MFIRDPFDLAPAAQRPTRAAWVLLASGILFALACAVVLHRSVDAVRHARDVAAARQEAQRAQERREAAARERAKDPVALEKLRAQQQLQRNLRMSWSGMFDALERAARKLEGRVSISSLAPAKAEGDLVQVNITGFALTNDVLLEYVETLQDQAQVKEVVLTSHEPAQSGAMPAVRFHLSLVWQPTGVAGATP
jgi:hypothetical protein